MDHLIAIPLVIIGLAIALLISRKLTQRWRELDACAAAFRRNIEGFKKQLDEIHTRGFYDIAKANFRHHQTWIPFARKSMPKETDAGDGGFVWIFERNGNINLHDWKALNKLDPPPVAWASDREPE